MYGSIHVPVDNSDHSNSSADLALALSRHFGAKLVGSHVYAAKLHDVRFKQMEFTLPDEYKEEEELEKQRKIHDALITRGLQLISDSYLDVLHRAAEEAGVDYERKHFDGKNFEAIVDDVNEVGYDLLVLGALGMGAVKQSEIGSVCERVLRRTTVDTLVVRDPSLHDGTEPGPILACLDGSTTSHGSLEAAMAIAKKLDKPVHAVAACTEGEESLMSRHLDVARELGRRQEIRMETHVEAGSAAAVVFRRAEVVKPWLIAVGRSGLDATGLDATGLAADAPRDIHIGSFTEHLVRKGSWNVLVSSRTLDPAQALGAADAA